MQESRRPMQHEGETGLWERRTQNSDVEEANANCRTGARREAIDGPEERIMCAKLRGEVLAGVKYGYHSLSAEKGGGGRCRGRL